MFREEKGITLVALVLIIVVLLIISGVAMTVVIQNSDMVLVDQNSAIDNLNPNVKTNEEDAMAKVKLIFEVLEANYQTELARGNVTDRKEMFTASNIIQKLTEYNVNGNTQTSLGQINLTSGVTVNYDSDYTFLVRVTDSGAVTVVNK